METNNINDTGGEGEATKSTILEKIKNNELSPRPKSYFTVRLVGLMVLVLGIFFISIFLSSLILFTLRASGRASLLGFGPTGFEVFLLLFPWKLLIVDSALVLLLEWLLRSFRFGYRIPTLYLFVGVVVLMIVSGYLTDRTGVHDVFIRHSGSRPSAPFVVFYDDARHPAAPPFGRGIFRATVTDISSSTLRVEFDDPRKSTTTSMEVVVPSPLFTEFVQIGDRVYISGKIVDGHIEAQGIKKVALPYEGQHATTSSVK